MVVTGIGRCPVAVVEAPGEKGSCKLHALIPKAKNNHDSGAISVKKAPPTIKTLVQSTRLCKFFLAGTCERGKQCSFAHGKVELQQVPDLKKTRLCARFTLSGKCRRSAAECKFAHGADELRRVPNMLGWPELCEKHGGGSSLRTGMLSKRHPVEDAASAVNSHAKCVVAGMSPEQQLFLQQLQASVRDVVTSKIDMYHHLQLTVQAAQFPGLPQPFGCQNRVLPGADTPMDTLGDLSFNSAPSPTPTDDTLVDLGFKNAPFPDTLPFSERSTGSESNEGKYRQTHIRTRIPLPQGWIVTVKNTFVHVEVHERVSNRSTSTPAAANYRRAI
eukprot:TRINITY_DN1333_c0_g4_i1.p1 TRINITY_DN1333_c0_g4~~TRINITY_DN1333_c0_g4_i1.p1  ORF type:complete len:331 (+),score=58.78 TRINITY_DN1333_c0_g4_i1:84-1076(+)